MKKPALCFLACLGWSSVLCAGVLSVLPPPKVFPQVQRARKLAAGPNASLIDRFPISGEHIVTTPVLAAKRLVISAGSRVVFAGDALSGGDQSELFIIADTIVIKGEGEPPIVTWAVRPGSDYEPPPRGQAITGAPGAAPGAEGGRGADGEPGNPGIRGFRAPTLYLVTRAVEGPALRIDLTGGAGGVGGLGQAGGDGGVGRTGESASESFLSCKRGGANGGRGGSAGNGGPGGAGGPGGDGGSVVILTGARGALIGERKVEVRNDGGRGGQGGPGGQPGRPGPAGRGGAGSSYCQAGQPGAEGAPGQPGPIGLAGEPGASGDFVLTTLTPEQFAELMGAQ